MTANQLRLILHAYAFPPSAKHTEQNQTELTLLKEHGWLNSEYYTTTLANRVIKTLLEDTPL